MIAFAFGFSAGVMLFVSYFSMLPTAARIGGIPVILVGIIATFLFMRLLHAFPLSKVERDTNCTTPHLERVGFFLILAILAHHLPEGAAIGVGFETEHDLGILLVIALAIHNLPEGIALAVPLIAVGKPPRYVLGWSLCCGMSLPLGTWIGSTWMNGSTAWMSLSLAFAAITMVWIIVYEVFPQAFALNRKLAIGGLVAGSLFMYIVHHFH